MYKMNTITDLIVKIVKEIFYFKKGIDHFPKGNIQYVNFENWNSYMKKISLIISANF